MLLPYADQLKDKFEAQFEEQDDRLMYRRSGKGAAYQVSEEEREAFIHKFVVALRWNALVTMAGALAIMASVFLVTFALTDNPNPAVLMTALVVPSGALIMIMARFNYYAMARPERELASRRIASPPLSPEAARAKSLSSVDYGQLAIAPLAGLMIVWRMARDVDPFHGWGELIWLIPVSLALFALAQAYRKYRLNRRA